MEVQRATKFCKYLGKYALVDIYPKTIKIWPKTIKSWALGVELYRYTVKPMEQCKSREIIHCGEATGCSFTMQRQTTGGRNWLSNQRNANHQ